MTTALELPGSVKLDDRLVSRIGHASYMQLTLISERLPRLLAAPSLLRACKDAASEIPGVTWRALYNRVRKYSQTGNPLDLVDRREAAALWRAQTPVGLPVAFQEFYRGLREKHQRVATQAHDELLGIWRTQYDMTGRHYERIPGYDVWPEANPATGIPDGWSYDNLQRSARSHIFDLMAARQGMAAARNYAPPVRTSRVGLKYGERVEFDDHDFDVKLHFAGQVRAMRPACFGGLEALSGFGSVATRPILWDEATEKAKTLSEFNFRCYVAWWLMAHGYRDDETGTTFYSENAKSVIREPMIARLAAITGGRVKVDAGRVFAESAHGGQFAPRGKGNPKHKPLIEGWWCMLENVLDRLPGRMGSNQRINGPAELHGREKFLGQSLELARVLPPDLAVEVALGVMTYGQFCRVVSTAIDAILDDPDHNLEGWEELEFTRMEWRSDARSLTWLPASDFTALPEPEQMALRARFTRGNELLTRSVRLTRREVQNRFQGELRKLTAMHLHRLLDPEDAFEVMIGQRSEVEFQDAARFGPGEFRFRVPATGRELYPGEKYAAFFNPLTGRWLQLVDAKGAHVAMLERVEVPSKADRDAVHRAMGGVAAWVGARKGGMANRHFDAAQTRAHMYEHNQRLAEAAAARQPGAQSPEMRRTAKRAAEVGRAMAAERAAEPIEGEVIDEVIETAPVTAETDLGEVEHIPMPPMH